MSTEDPQPSPDGQPVPTPEPPVADVPAPTPPPPAPPVAAPVAAAPVYAPPPAYAPPANQYQQPPQNGLGTAALVLGILGFLCLGPIGSLLAIIFGKLGMNKAAQGLANNGGQAKWGFWLGIVGLVLFVLGIILWVILIAAGVANGSIDVNTTST